MSSLSNLQFIQEFVEDLFRVLTSGNKTWPLLLWESQYRVAIPRMFCGSLIS